jgi:hypothetical protein
MDTRPAPRGREEVGYRSSNNKRKGNKARIKETKGKEKGEIHVVKSMNEREVHKPNQISTD